MWKLTLLVPFVAFVSSADVYLNITQGELLGSTKLLGLRSSYYSFKGIPYAEPPVGYLRFRNPRPMGRWNGVWDARELRSACAQPGALRGWSGDEDCLYLNVYSTDLTARRPVMVWMHGGAFVQGSGGTRAYGPDHLISEDVVLVTVNYRLGVLGFLSTGDRHAQGNYGLKDVVEALQWVQDNIRYFGGDPSQVTIFGESAGGVMVNYLVLSPVARGLFSKAISQSGVALCPWAYHANPLEAALDFSQRLNISATSNADLVNKLRAVSVEDIALASKGLKDTDFPRGHLPYEFSPVVEQDIAEPPFLTQPPWEILKSGRWNDVPYIIGTNSEEAIFSALELRIDPDTFNKLNSNPNYLAPPTWNLDESQQTTIANSILDEYFTDRFVNDTYEFIQYSTDSYFHYPISKTVKIMKQQSSPVYFYIFDFDGDLGLLKRFTLLGKYPGVMHGDEIFYLFKQAGLPSPVLPGNPALAVRSKLTTMWTNFAKFGNPTPEVTSTIPAIWPRVQDNQEYLWITETLTPANYPKKERMNFWERLDQSFGPIV